MGLQGFLRGSWIRHYSAGFLKFLKESQQVQLPSVVKKSSVGMNKPRFFGAARGGAHIKKFSDILRDLEEDIEEKRKQNEDLRKRTEERQRNTFALGDDPKENESTRGTGSDTPNPIIEIRELMKRLEGADPFPLGNFPKKKKSFGSTCFDMSPVSFDLHGKRSSVDQQPPIVSIPPVMKKSAALSDIMNELKRVAKPYPNLAIPKEYHSREYLGQAIPMFEGVNTNSSHSGDLVADDLVCELRVDVWPVPDYWMIHGIWPCYIHRSGWIVYFGPDKPIGQALAAGKEQVVKEICNLPPKIKETLHKIWKSYSQYVEFKKDAEGRDISFWAYEKVVHCWDDVGLPRGEYFNTTAKIGDAVRSTLLRWMVKSDIRPNHFYDSVAWGEEMKDLYDADVHLVMKRDDDINDPEATMITYLQGMSLLMKVDNNAGVSMMDHPLPPSRSITWQGKFFLLM